MTTRGETRAPGYGALLRAYLAPVRAKVVWLGVALLASVGLQLVVPLILQRFIDSALAGVAVTSLVAAGIAYLVAGVLKQVFAAVAAYLGADVGWIATNRLREDLAAHVLDLDMAFHTGTTPGEMIERIDGDVTAVANFVSRFLVRILGSVLLLVGVLVVSWLQHPWLGVAMTGYVIVSLAVIVSMRRLAVSASEVERETSAQLYGFIEERLAGIDDIRANGAGTFTMRRSVPVMREFFVRTVEAWRKRTIFWVTANTVFWSGDALALGLGVWLHGRGAISVGTAYLILQYVGLVRLPIEQVAQEFQELQKAAGGIIRIDRLREQGSELSPPGEATLPSGPLSVTFDDVGFAYEDRPVLESVRFHLEAGTSVGLLGRTGSGKTTITRLLARLYEPTSGTIRLAGVDLRDVSEAALRRAVGVVTQDVHLFGATVRDNLTLFEPRPDEDILATLDRVGLGDWVRALGLDTELGRGGTGLSAGEAQLLAFARVFLQDPGVVVLDEPSSRLDPATESLVATATARLFAGRTVIIVAHRLETVRLVDEIMVMDAGRVVEHGPRTRLASDPTSRYARLLAAGRLDALFGGPPTEEGR